MVSLGYGKMARADRIYALVPLDPKALNEREFALIKREVQVIEAPDGPRLGPRVEVEYPKVTRKGRGS